MTLSIGRDRILYLSVVYFSIVSYLESWFFKSALSILVQLTETSCNIRPKSVMHICQGFDEDNDNDNDKNLDTV